MNSSPNYVEWTREEKEQFAEKRMLAMKLENAKLLRRYAEVEDDRLAAESRNSSITNAPKAVKKDKSTIAYEVCKSENKTEYTREWDRGKPNKDNWKSPEHRGTFKIYRTGRYDKKDNDKKNVWNSYARNEGNDSWHDHTSAGHHERKDVDRKDTWGNYSRNETTDHYRHDRSSENMQNRKPKGNYRYKQHDDQHNFSHLHKSPKRTRGIGYRSNEPHRKSQHSYSDEKYKKSDYNRSNSRKKYSYRAHSRSSSRSDSDYMDNNLASVPISSIRASSLWQNDKVSEDQNKQNRVEKWVKSVNKSNMWGEKQFSSDQKEKNCGVSYSKFDRFERSSNKSSDEDDYRPNFNTSGENKSMGSSNLTSHKHDYHENKHQNRGAFSHNVGTNSAKQNDRLKGKTKRSPQYSSASSSKNENFRKQRRFDNKGFKNDEKNKFNKPKMHDNVVNDSWGNSVVENRNVRKDKQNSFSKNGNYDKDGVWNKDTQIDNPDASKKPLYDDDGFWSTAEQSNIKWKLSDEETDLQNSKPTVAQCDPVKKNVASSDTWNDNDICRGNKSELGEECKGKNENEEMAKSIDSDEAMWSHVKQDVKWNIEESEIDNIQQDKARECSEDYESSNDVNKSSLNEISEKMDKNCKINEEAKVNEDAVDEKMDKGDCSSNIETTKHQENSAVISQKSHKKNPTCSDDGGWSTVSEEGEIHSDDEGADDGWSNELCNKDSDTK